MIYNTVYVQTVVTGRFFSQQNHTKQYYFLAKDCSDEPIIQICRQMFLVTQFMSAKSGSSHFTFVVMVPVNISLSLRVIYYSYAVLLTKQLLHLNDAVIISRKYCFTEQ